MKLRTPDGVYLRRLITVRDLQRYGLSTDAERLEVRSYLRYVVRESTPGSARAMMSVVAGFFGVAVSFLVVLVSFDGGDSQVRNDSLVLLGIVTLLLLGLGGTTLVFAWREDRRNAIATSWLAEIEAVEASWATPSVVVAAPSASSRSVEPARRGWWRRTSQSAS